MNPPIPNGNTSPMVTEPAIAWRHEVRHADRDAVREIVASTGYFRLDEIEVAVELVDERLARGPATGYHFAFVDVDGNPIGYACYGPIACTLASFDLYWIAVHERHRGRGLGRQILGKVENLVREAGGMRLYIETSGRADYAPTHQFYLRCGYRVEARLADFYAPGDDRLTYVKALG